MQFAVNESAVLNVARDAETLHSTRYWGGGNYEVFIELFHDYYNTVNVRFRVRGDLVSITGVSDHHVKQSHVHAINQIAEAVKEMYREFVELPTIDADGLRRIDYAAHARRCHVR